MSVYTSGIYGIDAAGADKYEIKRLCNCYDRAFMKIFNSYDSKTIICCQWYMYYLDFQHLLELNRLKYLFKINKAMKSDSDCIFSYFGVTTNELNLLEKYNITLHDSIGLVINKVHQHFESIVHLYN